MTLRDAIIRAQATATTPAGKDRRNQLIAHAIERGAEYKTIAALVGRATSTVHEWLQPLQVRREAILNDPAPPDLAGNLTYADTPITGQTSIPA
jgi:transposase-like protein